MAYNSSIDQMIKKEIEDLVIHIKDTEEYFKIRILSFTKKEIVQYFQNLKQKWYFLLDEKNIRDEDKESGLLIKNETVSIFLKISIDFKLDFKNSNYEYSYNLRYNDKLCKNLDYDDLIDLLQKIISEEGETK